jgi:hypothetical protein
MSDRFSYPVDLWYSSIIIPLSSPTGKELFSKSNYDTYHLLNSHFEPQERVYFCGIACACILLKTLLPSEKWNQNTIYSNVAQNYMSYGITLSNLSNVLRICGLQSTIQYFENEKIEKQFRDDLNQQNSFIIVNYWRQFEVKEKGYTYQGGHFSLIGGFDQTTDHVLILDPSHTRFPHHWLPLKHLIRMICTYDKMSSMPRGYLIVTHPNEIEQNDRNSSNQFRTFTPTK